MDTTLILQVVSGLLVIFFIAAMFFASKNWQILHVVIAFGVFAASLVFLYYAAATLKAHSVWRDKYNTYSKQLAAEQETQRKLEYGAIDAYEADAATQKQLERQVERVLLARGGRVWRNVQLIGAQGNGISFNMSDWGDDDWAKFSEAEAAPAEAPAEGEPAEGEQPAPQARPHGLTPKSIVFVFLETPIGELDVFYGNKNYPEMLFPNSDIYLRDTQRRIKVPTAYLGEFRVIDANATALTLEPILPLDADQAQLLQRNNASWALYEFMPSDGYDLYADKTPEQLQMLFPQQATGLAPEQYEAFIDEFARDGKEALASDPPERTQVRVEFLQRYEVPVDAGENATQFSDRWFDARGLALPADIRQGEPTVFDPSDENLKFAVLDRTTADDLIGKKIAVARETLFVRDLRDYALHFRELHNRQARVEDQIQSVARDIVIVNKANEQAAQNVAYRQQEGQKLQQDKEGFTRELAAVTQLREALEAQGRQLRERLSVLYRQNIELRDRLAKLQREQYEAILRGDIRPQVPSQPEPNGTAGTPRQPAAVAGN